MKMADMKNIHIFIYEKCFPFLSHDEYFELMVVVITHEKDYIFECAASILEIHFLKCHILPLNHKLVISTSGILCFSAPLQDTEEDEVCLSTFNTLPKTFK